MAEPAPITLLTGFLGAGKTTLLNRLLRDPALADTAVLVNEFGDIGIDHLLIERIDDTTALLPSGCLCCAVQGDLLRALRDLVPRLRDGSLRRVVVETTGLADPAPIVQSLLADVTVATRFRLDGIVTVVDRLPGAATLAAQDGARRQVAMADRIVISKTDLAPVSAGLRDAVLALNPAAALLAADVPAVALLGCGLYAPEGKIPDVAAWLRAEAYGGPQDRHGGISTFCLTYDSPLDWQGIGTFLEMLVATRGDALLRVKGILNLRGQDRPVVIQGVQTMFHEPALLPAWPPGDPRTSRIVFITQGLNRDTIETGLRAFIDAAAA